MENNREMDLLQQINQPNTASKMDSFVHLKSNRQARHQQLLLSIKEVYRRHLENIEPDKLLKTLQDNNNQNLVLLSQDNQIKGTICFRVYKQQQYCELLFHVTKSQNENEKYKLLVRLIKEMIRILMSQNVLYVMSFVQKVDVQLFQRLGFIKKTKIPDELRLVYQDSYVKGVQMQFDLKQFIDQKKQVNVQQENQNKQKSLSEIKNDEQNIKYLRATFGLMEDKNDVIKGLENQIFEISKLTREFRQFITSQIMLDEDNQQDLIDIMNSNQMEDLLEVDPNIQLDTLTNIIGQSFWMEEQTVQIFDQKVKNKNELKKDTMMAYHQLEGELKKSVRDEEVQRSQLKNNIKTLEETEYRNKVFLKKTKAFLNEYKEDYEKLIEILNEKEHDIDNMNQNSNQKQEVIGNLEEKLLKVYYNEYLIKDEYKTHQREVSQIQKEYQQKLKDVYDPSKSQPHLIKQREHQEQQIKVRSKEIRESKGEIFKAEQEFYHLLESLKNQREELQQQVKEKQRQISEKTIVLKQISQQVYFKDQENQKKSRKALQLSNIIQKNKLLQQSQLSLN